MVVDVNGSVGRDAVDIGVNLDVLEIVLGYEVVVCATVASGKDEIEWDLIQSRNPVA